MNRKEWKKHARGRMKKHYFLFLFLCLVMGMLHYQYYSSVSAVTSAVRSDSGVEPEDQAADDKPDGFTEVIESLLTGRYEQGIIQATSNAQELSQTQQKLGIISLGHSRGAFSQFVVNATSGVLLTEITMLLATIFRSKSIAAVILVLAAFLITISINIFIKNVLYATFKRVFLEARLYDEIPPRRMLFFQRIRRWWKVSKALLLADVFYLLWCFTVIGAIIKKYSYYMVTYIVAENPSIGAKEAITLSRRMMKGHKWEAFVLELSFIGWQILDQLTLGLTGIFYSNPYHESTLAEYYAYVRQQAIDNKIQGYEALNDHYLFRKATEEQLKAAYADRKIVDLEPEDYSHMSPVKRFTRNVLGVCLFYDKDEDIYEARILQEEVQKDTVSILAGKQYPGRLFTISEKEKVKRIEHLNYLRHYSVCSLILIFFTICFGGWLWEVSIHLVKDGVFVNRGILHGPWLPIYGTGVVMILLILNKLRKNPFVQFASAIVLCGCLEYFTSYYLEVTHNGMKWWDYTGYFININGRVCAEGLLVFGLGGVAAVYLLAPLLDTSFRRIPVKKAAVICLVLMLIFTADQIYSSKHPNAGKGVTDYDTVVPVEMETGHR